MASERITVAFAYRRASLEPLLKEEKPELNPIITGKPGMWKLRRDRVPSDPTVFLDNGPIGKY